MMFTLRIASAAVAVLVLSTNLAHAQNVRINPNILIAKPIGCLVAGTPVEFPNDIRLVNKGMIALAAGTKIEWSVAGYSTYKGVYTLGAQLAPGKAVFLSGVLGGGVPAGNPCAAKVL